MKNLRLVQVLLGFALGTTALAQPQWRFHLAFEDATGARDTIWFVWDTTATEGSFDQSVDTLLGEGRAEMDLNAFNVWVYNWVLDSTKTHALPYIYFPSHGAEIRAFNYEFPIALRWDTALFHASYLPNPAAILTAKMDCAHFFSFNNDPPLQAYNMLLDDSVVVELMFPNDALFPLLVNINGNGSVGLDEQRQDAIPGACALHPNPARDRITWECIAPLVEVRLTDARGRLLMITNNVSGQQQLDVTELVPGVYIFEGVSRTNHIYHAKFIKQD